MLFRSRIFGISEQDRADIDYLESLIAAERRSDWLQYLRAERPEPDHPFASDGGVPENPHFRKELQPRGAQPTSNSLATARWPTQEGEAAWPGLGVEDRIIAQRDNSHRFPLM